MEIKCTDKKTFELTDHSEKLGYVTYDGFFSYKATVVVGSDIYTITPKGIFSNTIAVTKDGEQLGNMQMNWKGHIIISFQNGQEFRLKPTGTFLNKYLLEDKDQQEIVIFDPNINWAKLGYNYTIAYDNKPKDTLLVLLATYAANYYIATMSSIM